MRIARHYLILALLSAAVSPAFPQEVPNIAEVKSILQEAAALVPQVEASQRGSLAANISLEQGKAGDLAAAIATIQLLPKGRERDFLLHSPFFSLTPQGKWRLAMQGIEDLSENKVNSAAFLFVAFQLADLGDYENAVAVAQRILDGTEQSRFADAMTMIYARQFKAGDSGAAGTLNEALDAVQNIEQPRNSPRSNVASRYASLISFTSPGGVRAAGPIVERMQQLAAMETDPAEKEKILCRLAPAQAQLGDFAGALNSAHELRTAEMRNRALVTIASEQARQGDPAGASLVASEVSPAGWNGGALREFGLALGAAGDFLGALAAIEKSEPGVRAQSLAELALAAAQKQEHWALIPAQLALEATGSSSSDSPLQYVAVTRGELGDFAGARQIISQLSPKSRQWPLWSVTEELVAAGRKNEALELAHSQDDPYPQAYALLGVATQMLAQIETGHKKSGGR